MPHELWDLLTKYILCFHVLDSIKLQQYDNYYTFNIIVLKKKPKEIG